jgi:SlyX protein
MSNMDHGERLEALETRIAFQDQTIEDLNAALTEQWKVVEALTQKLARVEEQVRAGVHIADPDNDSPPPHY